MKILSKYHDYYDSMSFVYGEDEKIVYERKICPIPDEKDDISGPNLVSIIDYKDLWSLNRLHDEFPDLMVDVTDYTSTGLRLYGYESVTETYLIVCGKCFPVFQYNRRFRHRDDDGYVVFNPEKHLDLFVRRPFFGNDRLLLDRYNREVPFFKTLCTMVGLPVFVCRLKRHGMMEIGHPPLLGKLGLAEVYPADQLYQDISYYLANIIRESPDTMPATKMTDKEKIVAKGFDIKRSFRHRKKAA